MPASWTPQKGVAASLLAQGVLTAKMAEKVGVGRTILWRSSKSAVM